MKYSGASLVSESTNKEEVKIISRTVLANLLREYCGVDF